MKNESAKWISIDKIGEEIRKKEFLVPFLATILIGFFTHGFLLLNKLPNADAMDSFYFDQNMVTSGRFFLTIACGISSYYDLNWVNGVLSLLYLGLTAVTLTKVCKIQKTFGRILVPGLLVTFPAVTATFAYLYTADGYMLGLLMSVLAVYVTERIKGIKGILLGGLLLCLSVGTYQTYAAVTVLLCLYLCVMAVLQQENLKELLKRAGRYLGMGVCGGILYIVVLKICLAAQHKELDTYQGISSMGKFSIQALPTKLYNTIYDFGAFLVKGNILVNNRFSLVCMLLLVAMAVVAVVFLFIRKKLYLKWYSFAVVILCGILFPFATNLILLVSSEAYYHLLMRLQWGLFPIFAFGFAEYAIKELNVARKKTLLVRNIAGWLLFAVTTGIVYNFAVTDNIAYFNMNERYEKTYAYCLRLADRMEQTPGYEQGMKVAMIGVVSETAFPVTDVTIPVTAQITGTNGDCLLYKGIQFREFMKHYLNVSFDLVSDEEMIRIYNSQEYQKMGTFPAADSVKVVDGILYIKTE